MESDFLMRLEAVHVITVSVSGGVFPLGHVTLTQLYPRFKYRKDFTPTVLLSNVFLVMFTAFSPERAETHCVTFTNLQSLSTHRIANC